MIAGIVIKITSAATLYPALTADSTAASQVDNKRFRKAANMLVKEKSFNATLFHPRVKDREAQPPGTRQCDEGPLANVPACVRRPCV